jgi:hypothetical protein
MDRPEHLPKDLDKENLAWLRLYGYSLNNEDNERYLKVKELMKKWYTYEYYFFVDMDIKQQAERNIIESSENSSWMKRWTGKFNKEKRTLIKEIYGLEKKGIR